MNAWCSHNLPKKSITVFSFEIKKLRFTLNAIDPINLPRNKGSTFHGGFGHAMEAISPTWFNYFFQPQTQNGNDIPKPFVLLPPLDQQQNYKAGEDFQCELTLFANATQHAAIVQIAIEYLGNRLGLGYNKGKFAITDITEETFRQPSTLSPENAQTVSLNLVTRLRLKSHGQLQKQTPPFSLIVERLLGRLKTLQSSYDHQQRETPVDQQRYRELLHQSRNITTLDSTMQWDDWNRYSGRQKEWMKFGGLLGQSHYQGGLQPFMPYLRIGEWCHIGGKSSFGLGKYFVNYGE